MNIKDRINIHENCYVNNLQFYHKSNLIRAPLEALITIYLAEVAMMFSKWFVDKVKLTSPQIALMIFIPLLFALVVCLLYSGGVILLVNRKIYKLTEEFDNGTPRRTNISISQLYIEINEDVKKTFRLIHVIGGACYLIVGIITSALFSNRIFTGFSLWNTIILSVYALLMGVIWNIYGYYSDNRIDWSKIYKGLIIDIAYNSEIKQEKYKSYRRSVYGQTIVVAIITLILILVFARFDYSAIPQNNPFETLLAYSVFGAWFITILKIYGTQMFNIFFVHKEKGSEIFPSESEILINQ